MNFRFAFAIASSLFLLGTASARAESYSCRDKDDTFDFSVDRAAKTVAYKAEKGGRVTTKLNENNDGFWFEYQTKPSRDTVVGAVEFKTATKRISLQLEFGGGEMRCVQK